MGFHTAFRPLKIMPLINVYCKEDYLLTVCIECIESLILRLGWAFCL